MTTLFTYEKDTHCWQVVVSLGIHIILIQTSSSKMVVNPYLTAPTLSKWLRNSYVKTNMACFISFFWNCLTLRWTWATTLPMYPNRVVCLHFRSSKKCPLYSFSLRERDEVRSYMRVWAIKIRNVWSEFSHRATSSWKT